ncbi:MAG: DUF6114 domain-containing protein [Halorientalis sp.]
MSVADNTEFSQNGQIAAVLGAVAGAVVGGALITAVEGWNSMRYFAWMVGSESMVAAWGVWFALALVFGPLFGVWMARSLGGFTNTVIMVSRKNDLTQRLLLPPLRWSAITVSSTAMGLIYGNILGFGFFAYIGAIGLIMNGYQPIFPLADFAVIGGYLVYATVLGSVYGLLLEAKRFRTDNWVDLPNLAGDGEPTGHVGFLVGGVVSGIYLLIAARWIFRGLAWLVGLPQLLFTGFLVWMGLVLVLGAVFAVPATRLLELVARPLDGTLLEGAKRTLAGSALGLCYGLGLGAVAAAGTALWGAFPYVGQPAVVAGAILGTIGGAYIGNLRETVSFDIDVPDIRGSGDRTPAGDTGRAPRATQSEPDESRRQVSLEDKGRLGRFRATRPFAGSVLLVLSGAMVAAIPLYLQTVPAMAGMGNAALGIVWGALIAASGVFVMLRPDLSTIAGVTGVIISLLSLYGAFGGLVFGMLVGIVGGNLCIAWDNPVVEESGTETPFEWTGRGERPY